MKKLMVYIEQKITKPLIKISQFKYFKIIQKSISLITPLIIIGSFFMLSANILSQIDNKTCLYIATKLETILQTSIKYISILIAIATSYTGLEFYEQKDQIITPIILTLLGFFLMKPIDLSTNGIFLAILVSIVTIELYRYFTAKIIITIKTKSIPPMVLQSFISLIPSILIICFWCGLSIFNIPEYILKLFTFLSTLCNHFLTSIIFTFLNRLLWVMGIHGGSVMGSIITPVLTKMDIANQAALYTGKDLPYIFTNIYYDNYIWIGLFPVALIMCVSKSKRIKKLGLLELFASLFNISEALMFGLPIILNPILVIPFILSYVLFAVISGILTLTGFLPIPVLSIIWVIPAPIKAFLATNGSIRAFVYIIILWILLALIFYPFIKILEKE